MIQQQEREEIQPVLTEKRRKDEDRSVKVSHHNGEEDDRLKRHIRVNNEVSLKWVIQNISYKYKISFPPLQEAYNRDDRHEREKGHSQRRTGRNAH